MKKVIKKLFVNFEKEEKWINELAAKGLNLIDYSVARYLFEKGTPGEYIYRLELLDNLPNHPESKAYIKFMEETGAECVSTYMRWVYFRKKASEGTFDLYSDYDSKIKHYKRVAALIGTLGGLNLLAAVYNLVFGLYLGHERGFYFNAYISSLSWLIVILFTPMFISYIRKIRKMKKEKQIYE